MAVQVYHAVGKRKTSVARVYIKKGEGSWSVNKKEFKNYFPADFQYLLQKPFDALDAKDKYDIKMKVHGGGTSAQAQACMYGVAKALTLISEKNRTPLKKAQLLTRDSRVVERKKYGHKKARKSFQYSKR